MNKPESYQTKSINNKSHLEYTVIDIDKLFQPPKEYLFFQFEIDIINQNIKPISKDCAVKILMEKGVSKFNTLIKNYQMIIPLFEYYLKVIEEYATVGFAEVFIERYEKLLQEFKSGSIN